MACCKESACPTCTVSPKECGNPVHSILRDPNKTLETLAKQSHDDYPSEFVEHSLRPINPFWRNLPHCNIFACNTPDILHQLHKGVFKDHIVSWVSKAMGGGEEEIDRRFCAMTPHHSLRHFKKGISLTSQWTGKEHKNMEKVFLGILANATDPAVVRAVCGVLDFIFYSHFEVRTDESLAHLDAAWVAFHKDKDIFKELEIPTHFNISKLHNIKHYLDSIRSLGAAVGFNTEATERLHIDLAEVGYRASNKKAYTKQMITWLRRQDAVNRFDLYLRWCCPRSNTAGETSTDSGEIGDEDIMIVEDETVQSETWDQTTYHVAKKPALPHTSLTTITRDYGARDFLMHLSSFLCEHAITPPIPLSTRSTFSLYRRLYLSLPPIPEVSQQPLKDTIVATKLERGRVTTQGIKNASPARFSMVIV
ncbi:hypothetical protein H0H81_007855 [Sphagnurus paluster]|uniref:Uncharacterized protein n=1 Tax=Sphagnurus paluster TaxID=117069 RepID=A0A9P7FQI8_9AGAR|nr:hypothetical protein H0H81_007855 [Sphagnurus paluster]